MSINRSTITRIARRGLVVSLLAITAVSAFAILGDKGKIARNRSLLANENFATIAPGSFSLKSHYNFRGNHVINTEKALPYISLNTVLTYQKGSTTCIVPLKKKIYITTNSAGFTLSH